MFRGSTPTLPIEIVGADLTGAKLFLTIKSRTDGSKFTLVSPGDFDVEYDSADNKTFGDVTLTQEQTLKLKAGLCDAQIRYVFPDGTADATLTACVTVHDILMKDVIAYE